jgi:pyridoxamine 5'-phosphate oxidase
VSDERTRRLRIDYESTPLSMDDTADDPIEQFDRWFSEAIAAQVEEPNAMVLSTVSASGVPSSRTVLMKSFDVDGFVFFTNTGSRKGREIDDERRVSLLFVWLPLHRQVHIGGTAHPVSDSESDAYFASRPVDAQIGALASPQSSVIPSRRWLEDRVEALRASTEPPIRRPDTWGGYRVRPSSFEFWQGRPNRLHDRISFEPGPAGWSKVRLAP